MWRTEEFACHEEYAWLIAPNGQTITSLGAEQARILAAYLNERTTFRVSPS